MADGETLEIKIRQQDGNDIKFRVKRTTPFQKVFNAFCNRMGLDQELLRFVFESQRLRAEETPADHDMEDGDVIDAMVTQLGGSS